MARGLAEIDGEDITESVPAVIAAVTVPLTYSIASGTGLGSISYPLAKPIAAKFADLKPAVLVLVLLFAAICPAGVALYSANAFLMARKSRQARRFCRG